MLKTYRDLLAILTRSERKRVTWLVLLFTIGGMIEVAGVVSIMPFVTLLTNPGAVESQPILAFLYRRYEFQSHEEFLKFVGVLVFGTLLAALSLQALTSWVQIRFAQMRRHQLSCRLMSRYLAQGYEWSFKQQSADLATKVLHETEKLVFGALYPALHIISRGLVTAFLLLLLVVLDPFLALAIAAVVALVYGSLFGAIRTVTARIGTERFATDRERLRLLNEAFGGLKAIKLAGLEQAYLSRFRSPSRRLAVLQFWGEIMEDLPTHAIQAVAFGGMFLIVFYLLSSYSSLDQVFSVLAVYAFAGFRILPGLQRIFRESARLRFNAAAVGALHDDFQRLDPKGLDGQLAHDADVYRQVGQRLPTWNHVEFDRVTYRYPGASRSAVSQLSLRIQARTTVGLIGASGAGKSTTVDLLLALLTPTSGRILIDGVPLEVTSHRRWQDAIGYVPQQIYIADDTVVANIAFGVLPDCVDHAAVERAARTARLHDFVVNELEDGYQTKLGERGVRLSGGQLQRVGIARALYHDPDVLILDEATNALDSLTEQAVLEAVHDLNRKKTIIVIAHRLSTVRPCDRLFHLENGTLVDSGTYDELLNSSAALKSMTEPG